MGETPSSDAASPRGAMEEGQGALQDPRPAQERERPGRRARCGRQEGGKETLNTIATITKWLLPNHPEGTIFLISPLQGDGSGAIYLLEDNFSNWRLTTILWLRVSMRPARWNPLISLETASLVEKIMFARSWCVRRTLRIVAEPSGSPKRSPRCESNVTRRADTSLFRRLPIVSSDCLKRSEKEENSFRANSGWRFMASLRTDFRTTATRASVTASAKVFWRRVSWRPSSPKRSPSANSAVVASL